MELPRRWAVALTSENDIDLKIARALFQVGDPQVDEIKIFTGRSAMALFSERFETMSSPAEVVDASESIIDAINGICFIHDAGRSPLRRGAVHERLPTGQWSGGTAFASVTMTGRSRAAAFASAVDEAGNVLPPAQSRQSVWLQNAAKDDATLDVLTYIRGTPDWFLLYKAFEVMRADGGGATMAWPETSRFTRSANIRRHFKGHASANQTPNKPFLPMELAEGTEFVRSLATLWLNSKFEPR